MADNPSKSAKINKPKARLPRGLGDRGPAEIAATRRMLDTIRGVYERYGFEPVETFRLAEWVEDVSDPMTAVVGRAPCAHVSARLASCSTSANRARNQQ